MSSKLTKQDDCDILYEITEGEETMSKKTEFLYLSEPDMIRAGVLDMKKCINVSEEVFSLLAKGDYLMGGSNHNSHGMGIIFPKESPFPNMPLAGPDRRFFAMPAYLGGRFDVCGNKWYGSNAANKDKGLPRSVLTLDLNDKDTGEPLCFASANLLSSMRTGAVPGVGARYLANKDSKVCTVVGCGPINKACFKAIVSEVTGFEKVVCFDIFMENAEKFLAWSKKELGIDGIATIDAEEAFSAGDVITIAASRLKPLTFKGEWIKRGATVLFSGPGRPDDAYWLNTKIIYDHIQLHEAYMQEALESPSKQGYYDGVIGGPIYKLIDDGKLKGLKESIGLGEIVNGLKKGRENADEIVTLIACGMAVFDVAWGYDVYQNALENGIGTKLALWDEPYIE